MNKRQIVLAELDGAVRDDLHALIAAQADLQVVAETSDRQETLRIVRCHRPHVVVMDIGGLELNGREPPSSLAELASVAKVLLLAAAGDRAALPAAFSAGAAGYLLKQSAAKELARAIRAVADGVKYLDPAIFDELVGVREDNPAKSVSDEELSNREREVLRLIAQGFTNKEVAARLELSIKTVETYRLRSLRKLGLHGRAELVRYAMEQGWLLNS